MLDFTTVTDPKSLVGKPVRRIYSAAGRPERVSLRTITRVTKTGFNIANDTTLYSLRDGYAKGEHALGVSDRCELLTPEEAKALGEQIRERNYRTNVLNIVRDKVDALPIETLRAMMQLVDPSFASGMSQPHPVNAFHKGFPFHMHSQTVLQRVGRLGDNIVVLLDAAGGMSLLDLDLLRYVASGGQTITLVVADTGGVEVFEVKSAEQLDALNLRPGGGTILKGAIDRIAEQYNDQNVVIITDGYTERLDLSKLKGEVLVLTTGVEVPVSETNGRVSQLIAA